jgi:type II secretory pathway component HofQ
VRNKEKAKILIGDRVPVITTTSNVTGFVSESINYVDVGLKLEVEPSIYLDEEVAIKVNLEVSSLVREIISKSGSLAYQIGTRGASTVLRLKDGETQILAGLISDEDRSSEQGAGPWRDCRWPAGCSGARRTTRCAAKSCCPSRRALCARSDALICNRQSSSPAPKAT